MGYAPRTEKETPPVFTLVTQEPTATQEPPVFVPSDLVNMLSYRRGHGSSGEIAFINQYIFPACTFMLMDGEGENKVNSAYYTEIPNADGTQSTTLWSAHTDTVHNSFGLLTQEVGITEKGVLFKADKECLGADNGAGCWLLLQMIAAKVPGTYVFHRGEERGGIGSKAIAANYPEFLKRHTHAIAFDRRDTCSVISHQGGERCCSESFATQLSQLITDDDCTYILAPDDGGTFTDTKNYMRIIPECTNVSCGYFNEHGGGETLDINYLIWLRDRMITLFGGDNPTPLISERDPLKVERKEYKYSGYKGYKSQNYGWDWQMGGYDDEPLAVPYKRYTPKPDPIPEPELEPFTAEDICNMRWLEIVEWVENAAPEDVADLLSVMAWELISNEDVREGEVEK